MSGIDILTEKGEKTGKIASRRDVHTKGFWHNIVIVFILNDKGELLMQKRAQKKLPCPGAWDFSVCGHVDAGETVAEAALRELKEELGYEVNAREIKKAAVWKHSHGIKEKGARDNVFAHTFMLKLNNLKELIFAENEVEEIKFFSLEEIEKKISVCPEKFMYWWIDIWPKVAKVIRDFKG